MKRVAASLSYANVMATVAVFIALGGSSYALVRITGRNVPKDALTGADIRNLTGRDVRKDSLTGADIRGLTSADVANGALLAEDFAPGQLPRGEPGPPGSIQGAAAPVAVAANPESATDPCADPSRTLVLCGTASRHWENGGFGLPGLQVWRDGLGQVHVRGSVTISSGGNEGAVFRMPADMRPPRHVGFPVVTGPNAGGGEGGTALLVIQPAGSTGAEGLVSVRQSSPSTQVAVHLGEIVFRIDA